VLPQPHTRNTRRLSHAHGLASSPFAHHYSGNHYCFLFLRVLRCFTSPRYHQPPYQFRRRQHPMTGARFPHSEIPGSTLGCQLPGAYRRLPRPSSAPGAKASTVCPKKLEHTLQKNKMLAFTMQFSKHGQNQPPATTKPPNQVSVVWRPDQPVIAEAPFRGPRLRSPSVNARSLRTQQRAQTSDHEPTRVPTPQLANEPGRY
jgi:hypothetical protein